MKGRPMKGQEIFAVFFILVTLLAMTPGCVRQEGRPITEQSILAIKVGTSTEADVRKLLGPPDEQEKILGADLWIYRHSRQHGFFSTENTSRTVRIRFDGNGVVRQVITRNSRHYELF